MVHHGVEAGVGAKLVFTAEISLDGTELFDACAIGPSPLGATADNLPFAANNIIRDSFVAPSRCSLSRYGCPLQILRQTARTTTVTARDMCALA